MVWNVNQARKDKVVGRLDGKVALITGGARGLGEGVARLFVTEGAKVIIADVLDEAGEALAADLGAPATFYHLDVTNEGAWADIVTKVEADMGAIDILVNNAGILLFKTLIETSRTEYERVLSVNLVGQFLGIQAVAKGMMARGHGSIVNISSIDGMKGANGLAAYASSKWGGRGLTRVAAMELGLKGVRVNSIHPGAVNTMMTNHDAHSLDKINERFANYPLQRVAGADEAAKAILFLASEDASFLTGTEVVVDGGMMAGQYYEGFPGAPGVD